MAAILLISRPMMQPIMDAQAEKAKAAMMAKNPQITEDQANLGLKIGSVAATVGTVVGTPILLLVLGVFVWLVGKLFGASVSAQQGVLIASLSFVPRMLGSLLALLLSFVMSTANLTNVAQLTLSPARFMPSTASVTALTLAARFDLTLLWATAIIAIGYVVIGKVSKGKAYGAAILLWVLGGCLGMLGALRAG